MNELRASVIKTNTNTKMKHSIRMFFVFAFSVLNLQAQNYAFMYIADGTTTSSSITGGNWYVIGSETGTTDDFTAGPLSDWNNTTVNRLTATSGTSKRYLVQFSLSFGGAAVTNWDVGISVNGGAPSELLLQRAITVANKDQGNITGSAHLSLSTNDYLELQVKPTATGAITIYHAQVTAVELTDISESDYGGMTIHAPVAPQSLSRKNIYETLAGFTAADTVRGWTMGTDQISADALSAGTYYVSFSVSYIGDGPNDNSAVKYDFGIAVNGVDPDKVITRRATGGTDIGNIGACGIITISDSDKISVEVRGSRVKPITVTYSSLAFFKISGTTTSPYATMSINTDQNITNTLNTWTEVTGFTSGTLNSWTDATNGLNATTGTLSAGIYSVSYSASVDASTASDVVREINLGIYIGGALHAETRMNRKLSSNTDIGALSGLTLIDVDSDTDIVKMYLMNATDSGTLTVKKAKITLHRLEEGTSSDQSLPVELSLWEAYSGNGPVKLTWITESEIENQGFIIERKNTDAVSFEEIASFITNDVLLGQGSTTRRTVYEFIDKDVMVGETYAYRLSDVDYVNNITKHDIIRVTVKDAAKVQQPGKFTMQNAYPNPFNPNTNLRFIVGEQSVLNLSIYDANGRLVHQLVEGEFSPGIYQYHWDGVDDSGNKISTGVYFCSLQARDHSETIKMVYLK